MGLRFDPFTTLNAAEDSRLGAYLVGHTLFAHVWGDWEAWLFAPAGGGKTALRVRAAQACWIGQETNRPFPIPYLPPFLRWGHAMPTPNDHLQALTDAGARTLLFALASRPHWLLRLNAADRQLVRAVLDTGLPGPLQGYLDVCRETTDLTRLREILGLDTSFVLPNPPGTEGLLQWCDCLAAIPASPERPPASARWAALQDVLLNTLGVPSIYVLLDGLDAAPETDQMPEAIANTLAPLLELLTDWGKKRVYVKGFLPLEAQSVLSGRFPASFASARTAHLTWTPPLLAEVIRRRVHVASEGAFGSLDAIASPALRDIETLLAQTVRPLPREILVLTHRVLDEHVTRAGTEGNISSEDVDRALEWYQRQIG